jgi:hypothetical protein
MLAGSLFHGVPDIKNVPATKPPQQPMTFAAATPPATKIGGPPDDGKFAGLFNR